MGKEIKESGSIHLRRFFCYIVLIFFAVISLFSFYLLLINATRAHVDIQRGFSLLPGKSFNVI